MRWNGERNRLGSITGLMALLWLSPATVQAQIEGEREAAAIEFLSNGVPELAEQLRELKRERPDEYQQELERGLVEQADLDTARIEEPARYQQLVAERRLDRRCFELARQIRNRDDEQGRQSLMEKLEATVGELFDLRESWRLEEIEMLERELARLREEGARRRRYRDVIVQRRIEELTGLAELYAW